MSTHDKIERAAFEAWITAPPYEKPVNLNPEGSGFPGQYRSYEVQLAWEAYQAGRAALRYAVPALQAEIEALREALETMVEMVEMNGFGRAYAMNVARAALEHARRIESKESK